MITIDFLWGSLVGAVTAALVIIPLTGIDARRALAELTNGDDDDDHTDSMWSLGYEAAGNGEPRKWCAVHGYDCERGWDDYWEQYGQ